MSADPSPARLCAKVIRWRDCSDFGTITKNTGTFTRTSQITVLAVKEKARSARHTGLDQTISVTNDHFLQHDIVHDYATVKVDAVSVHKRVSECENVSNISVLAENHSRFDNHPFCEFDTAIDYRLTLLVRLIHTHLLLVKELLIILQTHPSTDVALITDIIVQSRHHAH